MEENEEGTSHAPHTYREHVQHIPPLDQSYDEDQNDYSERVDRQLLSEVIHAVLQRRLRRLK